MTDIDNTSSEQSTAVDTPTEAMQPAVSGKVMTQDDLDKLAISSKKRGYEKGYETAMSEVNQAAQQQQAAQVAQHTSPQVAVAPAVDPYVMAGMVNEQVNHILSQQQQAQDQQNRVLLAQRIQNELTPKIAAAQAKHADFNKVTQESGINNNSDVYFFANTVPNSGDVIHELAKSPSKLATFKTLANDPNTVDAAVLYIKKLSNSILDNENATNTVHAQSPVAPLSTIKSSPAQSSGKPVGVQDYKNLYNGSY